MFLRNMNTMRI